MKDEEMAEEWVNKEISLGTSMYNPQIEHYCKQAFLAGLKAGRPQWHDLRENPNDLPKEKETVVAIYENNALRHKILTFYRDKKWVNIFQGYSYIVSPIIAWCEIPTFDKE